jgi:hypothetical protein
MVSLTRKGAVTTPVVGSIDIAATAATAANPAAQPSPPADKLRDDASRADPRPRGGSDVTAHRHLPNRKGEAVADQGHTHRHDSASGYAAEDAANEQQREIGCESRGKQADGQYCCGDLDDQSLPEGIAHRAEERLAESERQRERRCEKGDNAN